MWGLTGPPLMHRIEALSNVGERLFPPAAVPRGSMPGPGKKISPRLFHFHKPALTFLVLH